MAGWELLPVDDVGYIHPNEILALSDQELRSWTKDFEDRRYGGWRNYRNLWRETLGLDTTQGKHVIDYGCGFGIEALQFARNGNRLTLFDLTAEGLKAAKRVLGVHDFTCRTTRTKLPKADVFYANGSLHHTPDMPAILKAAPCSEARLMVYSDKAWAKYEGRFVRAMDEVGDYADWYSPDKLASIAPDWKLCDATYITPEGLYLTATLERR